MHRVWFKDNEHVLDVLEQLQRIESCRQSWCIVVSPDDYRLESCIGQPLQRPIDFLVVTWMRIDFGEEISSYHKYVCLLLDCNLGYPLERFKEVETPSIESRSWVDPAILGLTNVIIRSMDDLQVRSRP